MLVVCFGLFVTASVVAQSSEAESRQTRTSIDSNGAIRLEMEMPVVPLNEERRARIVGSVPKAPAGPTIPVPAGRFDQLLLTAIQSHLGLPYHYAGTGPDAFDCSGFVWRTYQEAGFEFSRGPARSYWATFAAPSENEQYKFGNLVFFSGLAHVGIVVDEKGFYHASRHHGVIYSKFDDYWTSRIDGFRRVPIESMPIPAASAKPRPARTAAVTQAVEEYNQP